MKKPIFIGIAGGTGSGKSTFTNRLKETFGDRVSVVYYDNYYKRRDDLPFEERKKINYDHPDAFETELLIDQLYSLKNGQPVECPVYDYTVHNRSSETVLIKPADVILVEGIMVLQNPELRRLLDIKVYVEADADERILRRPTTSTAATSTRWPTRPLRTESSSCSYGRTTNGWSRPSPR